MPGRSELIPLPTFTFESVPKRKTFTGTVTTVGKVVTGVGTNFIRDLFTNGQISGSLLYPWFLDITNGQIMTIDRVLSATVLHLKVALDVDITVAQDLNVTGPTRGTASRIFGKFDADMAVGELDGSLVYIYAPTLPLFDQENGTSPCIIYNQSADTTLLIDYV